MACLEAEAAKGSDRTLVPDLDKKPIIPGENQFGGGVVMSPGSGLDTPGAQAQCHAYMYS